MNPKIKISSSMLSKAVISNHPIKSKGFTLIELVVAMAIFAVLTLSGWQVFNSLIKVRERTTLKAEQIAAIQTAYEQLSRDFVQAVPRPAAIGTSTEPAFLLQNNVVHLTRTGVIDPLQLGVSPIQRVYYTVEQEQLVRYAIAQVDQDGNSVPTKTILLSDVTDWTVTALSNSSSSIFWPLDTTSTATSTASATQTAPGDITLPAAVQITLTTKGQPLRWLFPLVTNMPSTTTTTTGSTTGTATTAVAGGASAIAGGSTTATSSSGGS